MEEERSRETHQIPSFLPHYKLYSSPGSKVDMIFPSVASGREEEVSIAVPVPWLAASTLPSIIVKCHNGDSLALRNSCCTHVAVEKLLSET